MRAFSVSSKYIFNSTASLNLILAIAMSSSAPTSAPTSAPAPNAAPLPPTNTPTASLTTIGVGKDITINGVAVKGNNVVHGVSYEPLVLHNLNTKIYQNADLVANN